MDGLRCTRLPRTVRDPNAPHLHFCATHWRTYDDRIELLRERFPDQNHNHVEGKCLHFERRRFCQEDAVEGDVQCARHIERRAEVERERREIAEEQARINRILEEYRARQPLMTWQQVVDDMIQREDWGTLRTTQWMMIARRYLLIAHEEGEDVGNLNMGFLHYWRWRVNGGEGPVPEQGAQPLPAPPVHTLARLARDRQNVHTGPVTDQTNRGLEKLLQTTRAHGGTMRSPDWFAAKWLVRSYGSWNVVSRIVNDMQRWYHQPNCRSTNDWLYRKALDGLYLLIRMTPSDETKIELFKRTFEECYESVGVCCDGHITRICNVLVGFDETFAPPVPFGEVLQAKMASIASADISTEEKVQQATTFFNEHNVPESERTAWLDAF